MTPGPRINAPLVRRLFEKSGAARWQLSPDQFEEALDRSVASAFASRSPGADVVERHLESLQLTELALAAACAAGLEPAWEHFVREHRPALYRAADAIDPCGGARDLADALYADLFGLRERDGERQSLFRYFHGRSSLATWLRAVLSQRHVDRLRAGRRLDPLPEDDGPGASEVAATRSRDAQPDPERSRYLALMHSALTAAIAALTPRERLRLGCYYAQDMTLAAIGKMLGEHEGTVSRHLTRTRASLHVAIDAALCDAGLDEAGRAECFRSVMDDAGPIDLAEMVGDPSTALRAGPSTALRAGPSTALRAGPSTPLRAGKVSGQDRSR